jgi:hypothetical protein
LTYIWDYYNIPDILTNIERYKMNAEKQTQVKSPTMQLIDVCQKQNELIFATRKRLFNLEHKQKTETILFSGLIAIQFIMVVALVVSHG